MIKTHHSSSQPTEMKNHNWTWI